MSSLVYYVSGHGFGHAVRSAQVIRALQRLRPSVEIHVRTPAPAWLFPSVASHQPVDLDVGVVQPDALHVDPESTLERAAALFGAIEPTVEREARFVRTVGIRLVVADIPPPAFSIAEAAGLPGVGIANFSWDWIYRPYVERRPGYRWVVESLRRAYARSSLLLRLPFHGDLAVFPRVEDVPLISRPASAGRDATRARLRLDRAERAVLLGFGGLGLASFPTERLAEWPDFTFLATEKDLDGRPPLPPNLRLLPVEQSNYNDLIGAVDAIVGKPGFGMVSASLAQRVPFLYTDREDFPEHAVLVEALERHGRALLIPRGELLAGNLGPHLERLLAIDRPWSPLRTDGDEVIARRLLALLDDR